MAVKILVVDDHQILRQGLRALLNKEPSFEVVGEADNGRDAIRMVQELNPDVVIMDVGMPDMNGIEATKQILAISPRAKVVALSGHDSDRIVLNMLKMGASGYLLKQCAIKEIITAIRTVLANRVYLSVDIADVVVKGYLSLALASETSMISLLTVREREVLQMLAEGKTSKQIAAALFVSTKTIESHRRRIMEKLNIYSIAGLTKFAIKEGLTTAGISP